MGMNASGALSQLLDLEIEKALSGAAVSIINEELASIGKLVRVGPIAIPGTHLTTAYTVDDAFGTKFSFAVPKSGTIVFTLFNDLDDEGLFKDLVLWTDEPAGTADADPFAPTDVENLGIIGMVKVDEFFNYGANQNGRSYDLVPYLAPLGVLWGQWVTRGADALAAGNLPQFSMIIQR